MPSPEHDLITERARVLRVMGDVVWVQPESQAGCARCAAGQGCGGGVFAKLLRGRLQELPVQLPPEMQDRVRPDDQVLIGLSTVAVQRASLLMYGLPLSGLLGGVLVASTATMSDGLALLGAASGLVGGLLLARWRAERLRDTAALRPVLLRTLPMGEPCPVRAEA